MQKYFERPKDLEGLPDNVKACILEGEESGEDDDWSELGNPVFIVETMEDMDKVFNTHEERPDEVYLYEHDWLEGNNWFYAFFSTSSYGGFHYFIPKALVEAYPKLMHTIVAEAERDKIRDAELREHNERVAKLPKLPLEETHARCLCEHISHNNLASIRTPQGNVAHRYGVYFAKEFVKPIATPYGTFQVCKSCANDCLAV